ncbi:hypothetical protein DFJ74DRAFT_773623 [Hyaloraphidium curvatum]|nr:hypothetical protein DFJ74DRAFT_773623 [Hyaloraphidium curvatum]
MPGTPASPGSPAPSDSASERSWSPGGGRAPAPRARRPPRRPAGSDGDGPRPARKVACAACAQGKRSCDAARPACARCRDAGNAAGCSYPRTGTERLLGPRGKRKGSSCLPCRSLKKSCDCALPVCNRCAERGAACSYDSRRAAMGDVNPQAAAAAQLAALAADGATRHRTTPELQAASATPPPSSAPHPHPQAQADGAYPIPGFPFAPPSYPSFPPPGHAQQAQGGFWFPPPPPSSAWSFPPPSQTWRPAPAPAPAPAWDPEPSKPWDADAGHPARHWEPPKAQWDAGKQGWDRWGYPRGEGMGLPILRAAAEGAMGEGGEGVGSAAG